MAKVDELLEEMKDKKVPVERKYEIVKFLRECGDKKALPALKKALEKEKDKDVKKEIKEAIKKLKEDCYICTALGKSKYVDFLNGEDTPEEFKKLRKYISDDCRGVVRGSDILSRCPQCDNYYFIQYRYDNDVLSPQKELEYERIPAERANQMLRERKRHKKKENQNKYYGI